MKISYRSKRLLRAELRGREFEVHVLEIPFREGVELHCAVGDEEVRISDRGLGLDEALRLLGIEIERRIDKQD